MTKPLPKEFKNKRAKLPKTGDIIGWKKAEDMYGDRSRLIKLLIPAKAARVMGIASHSQYLPANIAPNGERKCRAEFAKVLSIEGIFSGKHDKAYSIHVSHRKGKEVRTLYKVRQVMYPDKYDPDPKIACAPGIHFFLTKAQAEAY